MTRTMFPVLFTMSLIACAEVDDGDPFGGQTGEIAPPFCEEVVEDLTLDAMSSLNFSATEALDALGDAHVMAGTWETGEAVVTTVTLEPEQDAARFESGSDPRCRDLLRVPVRVTVETDNGALLFESVGSMEIYATDEARLTLLEYASANQGDLDGSALAGDAWDASSASIYSEITLSAAPTGLVRLDSHSEASGDQAMVDLVTW